MTKKKSDLLARVITAVVAIPLLLALLFFAPAWAIFALVTAAGFIVTDEYCSITYGKENRLGRLLSSLMSAAVASVLYFAPTFFAPALAAAFMLIFIFFLFTYTDKKKVSHQIGSSITGVVYGGVVLATLSLLVRDANLHAEGSGAYWILLAMAVVWGSDTGAYFAGRGFGKHKLYEAVSPNKTVEGAAGGVIASIAFAFLCNWLFSYDKVWEPMAAWQLIALAIPANLLAQIGDLAESLIKRAHDIKDSGTIIPGHGGMLDRIDGLIFAAPWFYFFFNYVLH